MLSREQSAPLSGSRVEMVREGTRGKPRVGQSGGKPPHSKIVSEWMLGASAKDRSAGSIKFKGAQLKLAAIKTTTEAQTNSRATAWCNFGGEALLAHARFADFLTVDMAGRCARMCGAASRNITWHPHK